MKRLPLLLVAWAGSGCTALIEAPGGSDQIPSLGSPGGPGAPGSGGGPTTIIDPDNPDGPGIDVLPGGLTLEGKPAFLRVVRLTHEQWENSVRDVLRLGALPGLSSSFIPDPPDGTFSNNERALYVTDSLRLDYQRAAETVSELVARDPAALSNAAGTTDPLTFVQTLGKRAFRRALSSDEEQRYTALHASGAGIFNSGDAFADGAQLLIEALLQSPNFLYRLELTASGTRLSGSELATKLSFLLRNTTPDDALLSAADAGQLGTQDGLLAIARQLVDADAARSVLEGFHSELYGLDRYTSIVKDETLFPTYTESLNQTLYEADVLFFDRVFSSGLGIREILTSKVAFVNQATAGFYGISAPGAALGEVMLDDSRPGFLTRLGFLAYNANLRAPDPIHRGVDMNDRVLCGHLAPPPGEIPALPEPVAGQTNRERVDAHTGIGTCGASCHGVIINPLGFSLESFDAIGQARTMDNGKPVDTSGQYAFTDGIKAFANFKELVGLIAENQNTHACYASKLTEFALARDLAGGDGELVTSLQQNSMTSNTSIKDMLLATVQNALFVTAKGGAP